MNKNKVINKILILNFSSVLLIILSFISLIWNIKSEENNSFTMMIGGIVFPFIYICIAIQIVEFIFNYLIKIKNFFVFGGIFLQIVYIPFFIFTAFPILFMNLYLTNNILTNILGCCFIFLNIYLLFLQIKLIYFNVKSQNKKDEN